MEPRRSGLNPESRRRKKVARILLSGLVLLSILSLAPFPHLLGIASEKERFITGVVKDAAGPVAGASVRYKGDKQAVLTDARGRFRLPALPDSRRVAASKEGYFIAGADASVAPLVLTLKRLPAEDCEAYRWVEPGPDPAKKQNCANCHSAIYEEWAAGGHSRSATNRRFLNLYDGTDWRGRNGVGWGLLTDHPEGAGVCASCHAPTVKFQDAAADDIRKAAGVDARGVHCDYCHKVADMAGTIGLTHGRFGQTLRRPAEGQLFFGPLPDVDRNEDAFAPLYRQSRYCASCHEGTVFGVHVYSTYSEWLKSPARREGKECQTCHMAPTGKLKNIAPEKGGVDRDPATLASHRLFAGNQADMLRRCLTLNATLTPQGKGLRAEVEVRASQVGHRVPTGFVDRNVILLLEAFAADGSTLTAASGPVLPRHAGPGFTGKAGKLYAKSFKDFEGRRPVPFWRARPDAVEDTRLEPDTPDRSVYEFPSRTVRVRVRLLHRHFWKEVSTAKGWPEDEIGVVDRTISVK